MFWWRHGLLELGFDRGSEPPLDGVWEQCLNAGVPMTLLFCCLGSSQREIP